MNGAIERMALVMMCVAVAWVAAGPAEWTTETPLETVRIHLGASPSGHTMTEESRGADLTARGRDLFEKRSATAPDGTPGTVQSKFFSCTHCHLAVREDPDLAVSDPEARLDYLCQRGLPLVPGTTLWGVVNKRSWYNGDYVKKYGDAVRKANGDLREAIQLCASACSQGRRYVGWELDAVLAYLWSLELKLGDFGLSESELTRLRTDASDPSKRDATLAWIDGLYRSGSPATFAEPPADPAKGYGVNGDFGRGHKVFELSCLHCHAPGRVLKWPYTFAYNRHTFGFLTKNFPRDHDYSAYTAIREGTSHNSEKAYMPNYTLERMSDRQIEDLRAFSFGYRVRRETVGVKSGCAP